MRQAAAARLARAARAPRTATRPPTDARPPAPADRVIVVPESAPAELEQAGAR